MRVVYRAIILVGAVLLVLFAVSNREVVSLGLWPLPFLIESPLYLVFFVTLLIGALVGASAAWIAGGRGRRELRRRRRRIQALEREVAATQAQLEDRTNVSRAGLPASRQLS